MWIRNRTARVGLAACLLLLLPAAGAGAKKQKVREELAIVDTTLGRFMFRFFDKEAPITVAGVKRLARAGFYDGTLFYKVLPGLLIEAGDPVRRQAGNAGPAVIPEAIEIEKSALKHRRAVVSMAHASDEAHSESAFFVCLGESSYFDGRHTIIGEVVAGMEVVEAISQVPRGSNQAPLFPVRIRSMTVEIQEYLREVK
jgi:cyclophilin family peptidyl-prolyl cis-trans isomerase